MRTRNIVSNPQLVFLGIILSFVWSFSAQAALLGRLETSPGSGVFQAYYDTQLNITWAANANINGADTWHNQQAWASTLSIGGVTDWRLPNMDLDGLASTFIGCHLSNQTQADCAANNEFGHLYFYGAGTMFGEGISSTDPGPFSNVQASWYWSLSIHTDPTRARTIQMLTGNQGASNMVNQNWFAWAVHDGDVGVVPIPAAVWLLGSGLIGLFGFTRHKRP